MLCHGMASNANCSHRWFFFAFFLIGKVQSLCLPLHSVLKKEECHSFAETRKVSRERSLKLGCMSIWFGVTFTSQKWVYKISLRFLTKISFVHNQHSQRAYLLNSCLHNILIKIEITFANNFQPTACIVLYIVGLKLPFLLSLVKVQTAQRFFHFFKNSYCIVTKSFSR